MEGTGIHPRVVGGRTQFPVSNTMKRKNPNTIQRTISAIERHLEKHPNDGMSLSRISKLRKLVA